MTDEQELPAEVKAELEAAAKELTAAVPIPEGETMGEVAEEDLKSTDERIKAALLKLQGKMNKVEAEGQA